MQEIVHLKEDKFTETWLHILEKCQLQLPSMINHYLIYIQPADSVKLIAVCEHHVPDKFP